MPLAVATNGPADIVNAILDDMGFGEFMEDVVSGEDAGADKPAPDVYLEACRRLDADPSDAIAFEDSPLGATAARRAGLFVVAVPSAPGMTIDADLVVSRLDDVRLLDYLDLEHGRASSSRGGR
jgi:beta-phosphoglucomutase-like phosphatase (HAD superfamily)